MYGIVNKAIQELVEIEFGPDIWARVHARSGIQEDFFISNEAYDDDITYKLAGAVSEETGMTVDNVLIAFGEHWVLKTGKEKYGSLMEAGGDNLRDFLVNLPNFHSRVMLYYPKLTPPEFHVSEVQERSLNLHYISKRPGLKEFVRGLLQGLGKLYRTEVEINLTACREEGSPHEIYNVKW